MDEISTEGLQFAVNGMALVQKGLMVLRYIDLSPNSAAAQAALESFTEWEHECEKWRERLVEFNPLPMALADINENLLYLSDRFARL